jgi:hypothetical protein
LGGHENLPRPSVGIAIDKLVRLLTAMTTMECGVPYTEVDTQAIIDGYELAFPGKLAEAERLEELRHLDEYWDWSPKG